MRRTAVIGALGLSLAAVGFAARVVIAAPPPASDLVAKIVAAEGGASVVQSIQSVIIVATGQVNGNDVVVTSSFAAPTKWVQAFEIPSYHVKVYKGFDGTSAWQTDTNGDVDVLAGDQATAVECQAIDSDPAGIASTNWPRAIASQPDLTLDGKTYHVLSVTPKGCPLSTFYVDPQTYLIDRVDESGQTLTFSDFKKGPSGEIYATSVISSGAAGVIAATVTSRQDNPTISPSTFAVPPGPVVSPNPGTSPTPTPSTAASASPTP
jgi:hypothetical protein